MKHAAAFLMTVTLLFSLSGQAGGWITSGQQRAAPAETTPVSGPFKVSCTISVDSSKNLEGMTFSEEFTDSQFRSGHLTFVTPGLPGKSYLAGHQISLSMFRFYKGPEQMRLSLEGVLRNKYYTIRSNAVGTALRSEGVVRTSVSIRATRPGAAESLFVSASCREIN